MKSIRIVSVAVFIGLIATASAARAQPAMAASPPAAGASVPNDCAKPKSRHNHGADKGLPASKSMSGPCAPAAAASGSKTRLRHDHPKFNKNQ